MWEKDASKTDISIGSLFMGTERGFNVLVCHFEQLLSRFFTQSDSGLASLFVHSPLSACLFVFSVEFQSPNTPRTRRRHVGVKFCVWGWGAQMEAVRRMRSFWNRH